MVGHFINGSRPGIEQQRPMVPHGRGWAISRTQVAQRQLEKPVHFQPHFPHTHPLRHPLFLREKMRLDGGLVILLVLLLQCTRKEGQGRGNQLEFSPELRTSPSH